MIESVSLKADSIVSDLDPSRTHLPDRFYDAALKVARLGKIIGAGSTSDEFHRETPILLRQIRQHLLDMDEMAATVWGPSPAAASSGAPTRTFHQWKAEMHSLLDQVDAAAARKDWDRIQHIADLIVSLSHAPLPPGEWRDVQGIERTRLERTRDRVALYAEIMGEYAQESNPTHVAYFHDKIVLLLQSLP